MKVVRIHFPSLRNDEWYRLMSEIGDLLIESASELPELVELRDAYIQIHEESGSAIVLERGSVETGWMREADRRRNLLYRGLVDSIRSSIYHSDGDHRMSARQLAIIVNRYGNLSRSRASAKTIALRELTSTLLNAQNLSFTSTLGLTEWVTDLSSKNESYALCHTSRAQELTSRSTLRLRPLRTHRLTTQI